MSDQQAYERERLDGVERDGIQTAAFCAYVMRMEQCDQPTALKRMGELCVMIQIALGLGNKDV